MAAGAHAGTAYIDVKGDFDAFDKDLDTKAGSVKKKMGAAFKIGAAAAAVGVSAGVVAVKGFVDAAKDAEASGARVRKMLENQGISWAKHGKAIDAAIQKHSQLTGIDDEELAESFANMVRTTGNVNEALKLNALAADVARTKGQSLAGAQSLLARVYNGSYTGLKRLGIAYDPVTTAVDQLKATTKNFTQEQLAQAKATDKLTNQQEAMALLQKNFGGQAEAYGKTAAGAQERLNVAWENLQETLGEKLLPVVADVTSALADFVNGMQDGSGVGGRFVEVLKQIGKAISEYAGYVRQVVEALMPVFRKVFDVAREQVEGFLQYFRGMAEVVKGVVEVVKGILHGDFSLAWEGVKDIFSGGITAAIGAIKAMTAPLREVGGWVVGQIVDGIKAVPELLLDAAKWVVMTYIDLVKLEVTAIVNLGKWAINRVAEGLKTVTDALGSVGSWIKNRIVEFVQLEVEGLKNIGSWIVNRIVEGFKTVTEALGSVGGWLKNRFVEFISGPDGILGDMKSLGGKIIDAIVDGIKGGIEAIKGAAKWLKDKVVGFVKDFFGISSPSKVMMELGGHIGEGLIKGVVGADVGGFIKRWLGGIGSLVTQIPVVGGLIKGAAGVLGSLDGDGPVEKALGDIGGLHEQVLRALAYAKSQGWKGQVTSGYRSIAEQQYLWDNADRLGLVRGKTVARPGSSSHQSGDAIDVTDFETFRRIMATAPANARLKNLVPGDPVHFSVTGHAQGTLNARRGWAMVGEQGPELMRMRGGEQILPNGVMPGVTVVLEGDLAALAPYIRAEIREDRRQTGLALRARAAV